MTCCESVYFYTATKHNGISGRKIIMAMKGVRIGRDVKGDWHDINGVTITTLARWESI